MSKSKLAVLAFIFSNIIWGAGAPIFKWSLESIHPFTLAFFRFAIPMIIIGLLMPKNKTIHTKDIPNIFLAGISAITFNIAFFFLGIEKTMSINALIIGSSGPIFLVFFSLLFLQEKFRYKLFLGNILGFLGIALIIIQPLLHSGSTGSFMGNIFLILSMLGGVIGAIFSKKVVKHLDPMVAIYYTFMIGSLTFLPFAFKEVITYGVAPIFTIQSIVGIVFGSIFSSFIAYYLFFWGLKYFPVSATSVFSYIDPVAGMIIAVPLLHEYPNSYFILGSFLVFLGIYVAEGRLHYHPLFRLLSKD